MSTMRRVLMVVVALVVVAGAFIAGALIFRRDEGRVIKSQVPCVVREDHCEEQ